MSQRRYALDILKKANMKKCKAISTLMASNERCSEIKGQLLKKLNIFQYRSVVGGLQYLTITRPDSSFTVNRVCPYVQASTDVHWATVKRILRYVKGTLDLGLKI